MLTVCVVTQSIYGKSLFEYNVNPEYDLVAEESTSYSNFWPSSEFYSSPHIKHHIHRRGHGNGKGKRKHELPLHSFDISPGYFFPDSSEEFGEETYFLTHPQHPHGLPPGQAKKQGRPHGPQRGPPHGHPHDNPFGPLHGHPHAPPQGPPHGHPHGPPHGHPHEPPRRFPPPPVYDKDFINPWAVSTTTPLPFIVQQPPLSTPNPYVAPKLTTTPAPPTSTTNENGLVYDIDVRFGRD
ncbi:uncharacterized protein ACRADG_000919 isoform 2-T2 [Cochliomyia hominivorax]